MIEFLVVREESKMAGERPLYGMSTDGIREGMNLRFNFTPPAEDEYEDDITAVGHELTTRQAATPSPGGASPSGKLHLLGSDEVVPFSGSSQNHRVENDFLFVSALSVVANIHW